MLQRSLAPVFFCLLLCACATEFPFEPSTQLPAAEAVARLRYDTNRNTLVELDLRHMAQAIRLSPPRSVYVVWAEGEQGRFFELGQLRVNDHLEAQFRGTSPLERFRIVITAEYAPRPLHPSEPYMLVTDFLEPEEGWLR